MKKILTIIFGMLLLITSESKAVKANVDYPTDELKIYPQHPGESEDFGGILGMHYLWVTADSTPRRSNRILLDIKQLDQAKWVVLPHVRWETVPENDISRVCTFIKTAKSEKKKLIVKIGSACLEPSKDNWSKNTPPDELAWIADIIPQIVDCQGFDTSTDYIMLGNEPNLDNCDMETYADNMTKLLKAYQKPGDEKINFATVGLSPHVSTYREQNKTLYDRLKSEGVLPQIKAWGYHGYENGDLINNRSWITLSQDLSAKGFKGTILADEIGFFNNSDTTGNKQYDNFKTTLTMMKNFNSSTDVPIEAAVAWLQADDGGHLNDLNVAINYGLYCDTAIPASSCGSINLGNNPTTQPLAERKAMTLFYSQNADRSSKKASSTEDTPTPQTNSPPTETPTQNNSTPTIIAFISVFIIIILVVILTYAVIWGSLLGK
ncbi:MAG: hypothetical protein WCP97_09135 [bacterium]